MNFIDLTLITLDEARYNDYGRDNVLRLIASTVEPMALAAPSQEVMKTWLDKMQDNIDFARSQKPLQTKTYK